MNHSATFRWSLRAALLAVTIGGAGVVLDGLWMPAKAALGQVLLEHAYDNGNVAPWPGADIRAVARINVPGLDESAIVLDSASGKAMAWGPGHVRGTSLPGDPGLSAIGGHRDSHLAFLGDLGPGQTINLDRADGKTVSFTVTAAQVVDSRTWRYPVMRTGRPRLALTTCWPLNARRPGPMRLVIYAEASPN